MNLYKLRYGYALQLNSCRRITSPAGYFRTSQDMRTKEAREALPLFVALIEATPCAELDAMATRHNSRARAKNQPTPPLNVLHNPLYLDWCRNRGQVWQISDNGLHFRDHRNHWAKSDFDRKVLQVLKRYTFKNTTK